VESLEDDSQAIVEAKKLFQDSEIPAQLAIIKANFPILVNTITALEERLPLVSAVQLVEKLQVSLTLEPFATKLQKVLDKNPGFQMIHKLSRLLRGVQDNFEGQNPNDSAMMANAPIVSCEVERFFSTLKDVNVPKRASLTEDHIKDILMVQWNGKLVK